MTKETQKYLPQITPEMLEKINDLLITDFDRLSIDGQETLTTLWELIEIEFDKKRLSVNKDLSGVEVSRKSNERKR
jgi:hypothetical protein